MLHLYQGIKIVKSFKGSGALPKLKAAMAELLQQVAAERLRVLEDDEQQRREAEEPVGVTAGSESSAEASGPVVSRGRNTSNAGGKKAPPSLLAPFSATAAPAGSVWDPPAGELASFVFRD